MTQANQPLQRRAGLNIGVEPSMGVHLQDAGAKERILDTTVGSETVILECPPKTARTPLVSGEGSEGMIINNTASGFAYRVFFRDELGNDIPLGGQTIIGPNVASEFNYGEAIDDLGFTLTPGQKIVIKAEVGKK
jgi:hypothetical protein